MTDWADRWATELVKDGKTAIADALRKADADALEEAARVAEGWNAAGEPIAAAIRALMGKP